MYQPIFSKGFFKTFNHPLVFLKRVVKGVGTLVVLLFSIFLFINLGVCGGISKKLSVYIFPPSQSQRHCYLFYNFPNQKHISIHCSPSLAGDDTHFVTVPMWSDTAGLPPLIIRGVDDVEDVPVPEAEPLAGKATVL